MDIKIEIKEENPVDLQNQEEFLLENTTVEMKSDDYLWNEVHEMDMEREIKVEEVPFEDHINCTENVTFKNGCEKIEEGTAVTEFTSEDSVMNSSVAEGDIKNEFWWLETSAESPSVSDHIKDGIDDEFQSVKPPSEVASKRTLTENEVLSIINEWSDDSSYFDLEDKESDVENIQQSGERNCDSSALSKSSDGKNGALPVGNASTSVWKDVKDVDPGPPKRVPIYNLAQKSLLPPTFGSETNPSEYFSLFFDDELISLIQEETGLYGNMKKMKNTLPRKRPCIQSQFHPTTADIKALLGVTLNMGLHPLSDISDYFSDSWINAMPFFSDVFPKEEFMLLYYNLHFSCSNTQGPKPRIFLIEPVLEHVKRKSYLYYSPSHIIGISESTIKFPVKPPEVGVKMFIVTDRASGYIYNFKPFTGKIDSSLSTTTHIVKELCSSLIKDESSPPAGYHIYTDKHCTSPELAEELLAMNFAISGTVLPSRLNMPPQMKATFQKLKKGDMLSFRKDNILALAWGDKQTVLMLSTYHSGSKRDMSYICTQVPNNPDVLKPNVILDYNKYMDDVDHSDHLISSYQFLRRSRRWSRKVFIWCLEVSVINSYILYCMVQKQNSKIPMSQKEFRQALVQSLVEERMIQRGGISLSRSCERPFCGPPEQRLDGKQHFIQRVAKRGGRCCVCYAKNIRKETVYYCETCSNKPYLHPDMCFKVYHTKKCYKNTCG